MGKMRRLQLVGKSQSGPLPKVICSPHHFTAFRFLALSVSSPESTAHPEQPLGPLCPVASLTQVPKSRVGSPSPPSVVLDWQLEGLRLEVSTLEFRSLSIRC